MMKEPVNRFSRYIKNTAMQIIVLLSLLVLIALFLDWQRLLIAPQFVASISFDEKIRFFRENRLSKNPQITALGSSITMNGLDGGLLKNRNNESINLINFAFYGFPVEELKDLAQLSVKLFDQPSAFLFLSSPMEFGQCLASRAFNPGISISIKHLNQQDVFHYVHSTVPALYYHIKYRSLWRMLNPSLLMEVQNLRKEQNILESLHFDRSGSVTLNVTKDRLPSGRWEGRQWSDAFGKLNSSNSCYAAFQTFADYAKRENIPLIFVMAPIRKAHLDAFDPQREKLDFHREKVVSILQTYGFEMWDAQQDLKQLSDEHFTDAVHLNRQGAAILTQYISQKLNQTEPGVSLSSN